MMPRLDGSTDPDCAEVVTAAYDVPRSELYSEDNCLIEALGCNAWGMPKMGVVWGFHVRIRTCRI